MKWESFHVRVTVYLDQAVLKGIEAAMVVKGKSRYDIYHGALDFPAY